MSNWPIAVASKHEVLGAGTGDGATVTTGAANTKGAYATIGTTGFRYSMLLLSVICQGSADRFRIDVAVNNGGADTIIVEDFFIEMTLANTQALMVEIPVKVPTGAVIKVRAQATGASRTLAVIVNGFAKGFTGDVGYRGIRSFTDWTNTMPTNSVTQTGNTFSAWTQIMASTPVVSPGLWASVTNMGDTTRTASDMLIEIGIGASGSERAVGSILSRQSASGIGTDTAFIPRLIPASTRLSFRVQCSAAGAADSVGVAAMGLVA